MSLILLSDITFLFLCMVKLIIDSLFQIVIQVPVTLMRSFTYPQLKHNFSVVITAGVDPNNYTAFLPNNIQARSAKDL